MRDRGCRRRTCRHVGMGVRWWPRWWRCSWTRCGRARGRPGRSGCPDAVVVLHADWSLGPVDVYINQDEVLSGFAYGQVSD